MSVRTRILNAKVGILYGLSSLTSGVRCSLLTLLPVPCISMFTLFQAGSGALLIQFATTAYLSEAGKTVGFSSIAYNAVMNPKPYEVTIVAGMLASVAFISIVLPEYIPPAPPSSLARSVISGLLVGIGTYWGSGCTSGHMLCGLSRLRLRSLVATIVFSASAMFMVNYFDLAPSCGDVPCSSFPSVEDENDRWKVGAIVAVGLFVSKARINALFTGFKVGLLFGLGLLISGMANPSKPLGFLALFDPEKFDPSLSMIILFAVLPNIIEWQLILRSEPKPKFEDEYDLPSSNSISPKFLLGCAIFGIGWGLQGVCPGPGILNSVLSWKGASWMAAFYEGRSLVERLE